MCVTECFSKFKDDTYRLFDIKNEIRGIPNFIELNKDKLKDNIPCHRSLMANEDEKLSLIFPILEK